MKRDQELIGFLTPEPIKVTSVNVLISLNKRFFDRLQGSSEVTDGREIPTLTEVEKAVLADPLQQ
jgi:hypothetical protein